jgi:peptidoglycan/LPS O-acetylase OafA/YrhL
MTEPIALRPAPDQPPGRAYLTASLHVPALDGVRGVAILFVLVYHLVLYGLGRPASVSGKVLYEVALNGWIGVDLFFVLSGFLITGILYDTKGGTTFFRNFYARRCLRIFPLYFAVLTVVFGLLPLLVHDHRGLRALVEEGPWYWTYTSNLLVARDGWPHFLALAHFWSLAVEEQFYLLWPLVVFFLGRRPLVAVCLACVVLSLCLRVGLHASHHGLAAYVLMPARMDALAAGGLVALIGRGPSGLAPYRGLSRWVACAAATTLAAMAAAYRGLHQGDTLVITAGLTLFACLFASLLILVLTAERTSRISALFGWVGLRFLGRYSYGLYVFHHPLLFITTPAAVAAALNWHGRGDLAPRLVIMVGVTGLSVGLAVLSWHLFERHFLRLKDRWPYSTSARRREQVPLVPDGG